MKVVTPEFSSLKTALVSIRLDLHSRAVKAGFDWYRAMPKDAEHNAKRTDVKTPMLYLRGDADAGRNMDEYVAGLKNAGVINLESGVLPNSGEYAPEEAPGALIEALRRFRRSLTCASR